ncbi:MAG TPA: allophanate hydrolase [Opitutales bacterium]|nr:allophanate hydrolase [Opitutales bacterium]
MARTVLCRINLVHKVVDISDDFPPQTISAWPNPSAATDASARVTELLQKLRADDPAWILLLTAAQIEAQFRILAQRGGGATLPLYGIPFAVKDNIDVEGLPTTAACPEFSYIAKTTAPVVQRLLDAGAILLGKTNLDQFATGLVGTRTPYGAVPNVFNPRYISGGSSAGSASVVARGQVCFALGTDTAGSGRVPAGFNNVVGLKPTRGWLSTRGVLPACRTLDCVSIFALTVEDAALVASVAAGPDEDAYSRTPPPSALTKRLPARPTLGVPLQPKWFGDTKAETAFTLACAKFEAMGAKLAPLDFTPLFAVAALLYQGPWVAERYAAIEGFIKENPQAIHPVLRGIIGKATQFDAVALFKAQYKLAELKRTCDALLAKVDALLVPTTPAIYTIEEIDANPVELNSRLGTYTNFVNLLDWCALSLPAGFRSDGLPSGVTLIGPAWADAALAEFGQRWQRHAPWTLGATGKPIPAGEKALPFPPAQRVRVAVVGAHLSGMPLNGQLTERGAVLAEQTTTSADYQFYALPGTVPPKPGLVKTGRGAPIMVELWDMPVEAFGSFVALIPSPLGIGTLTLADGRQVKGFICEPWATAGAREITSFGGWRAFMAETARANPPKS